MPPTTRSADLRRRARGSRAGRSAGGCPSTPRPRKPLREPVAEEHEQAGTPWPPSATICRISPGAVFAQNQKQRHLDQADHAEPVRIGARRDAGRRAEAAQSVPAHPVVERRRDGDVQREHEDHEHHLARRAACGRRRRRRSGRRGGRRSRGPSSPSCRGSRVLPTAGLRAAGTATPRRTSRRAAAPRSAS